MNKKIFFVFVFILSLLSVKVSFAEMYFYDDFSENNLNNWVSDSPDMSQVWKIEDGRLKGAIINNDSTINSRWNGSSFAGDYKITAEIENTSGIDQNFFIRESADHINFYEIGFRYNDSSWSQDNNNIVVYKFSSSGYQGPVATYPGFFSRSFNITQNQRHNIEILAVGNNIKVYFDGAIAINYTDISATPYLYGGIGLQMHGGNVQVETINYFDNIIVSSPDDPGVIPTLTPIPLPKKKIIIIPGLGASWNTGAIVYNDTVPDNSWRMTPFVNNYQSLIDTLNKGGLHEGEDFYVWNYDWRRPVSEIIGKLDAFIHQNVGDNEKVELVGHSLGALTARIWAQTHSDDPRLDKVIALGGPQEGSLEAYDAWSGASLPEGDLVENIALNVLVQLQKKNAATNLEALRNYAPVLKDLMPIFNFAKKNGNIVNVANLKSVNDYLANSDKNLSSLTGNIVALVGTGVQTKEWVNLGATNIFNQILGYWPDGEPISFDKGDGDGTVLSRSADLNQNIELNSKHGDLVTKGTQNILSELGLDGFTPVIENTTDLSGKIVFFIGSPAYLNVTCDGGTTAISDDDGFTVVDGTNSKYCRAVVIGTSGGTYHIVTGKVGNDDSWSYYENEIGVGKSEVVTVDAGSGLVSGNQNSDYWYELIMRDINLLIGRYPKDKNLSLAKEAAIKKNINLLIEKIFCFRNNSQETIVTGRIIDNLREVLVINNKKPDDKLEKVSWRLAKEEDKFIKELSIKLSKKGWKPSEFTAVNYQKIVDLEKNGDEALARGDIKELSADATLLWQFIAHFW